MILLVSEVATKLHVQPETSESTLSTAVTQIQMDSGENTPSNAVRELQTNSDENTVVDVASS